MCFGCPSKNLIYAYFVVPFMPSTNLTYLSLTTKVGTCLLVSFWNFPCFYLNLLQYWWSFMSGLMYSFQISSLHWSCILKSVGDCVMSRQHYSAIEKELEYMCFLGPWSLVNFLFTLLHLAQRGCFWSVQVSRVCWICLILSPWTFMVAPLFHFSLEDPLRKIGLMSVW